MVKRVLRLVLFAVIFGSLSFLLLGCGFADKLKIQIGDSSTEISARVGETLPMLKRPSKKGFSFVGWSQDGKPVDIESPLVSSSPLNAEFVEDTEGSEGLRFARFGKGLEVTGGEGTEYETLTIPAYAAPFAGDELLPVLKIGESAFRNAKIRNLILPDTLQELGASSFENAALPHPYLPYALTKIEDGAFRNASGFLYFDCPERVVSIAPTAFVGLKISAFRSFGKKFVASGVALFTGNTLFAYPAGAAPRNYESPDFVDTVEEYAFYGQTFGSLSLLNVARIAPHALENASASELNLPSLKILEEEAMRGFQTETLAFPASAAAFGARSVEALRARRIVFRGMPSFQNAGNPEALIYTPADTVEIFSAVFPERIVADAALLEGTEGIVVDGVLVDCPDGVSRLSVGPEVREVAATALSVPNLETVEFTGAPPRFGANVFYGSSALRISVPARYLDDFRSACPAYADRFAASEDETEPETATVTLDADGALTEIELRRGSVYRLPVLEKTGYRFTGWTRGDRTVPAGAEITVTEDVTYKASFDILVFSVSFYANGALLKTETVPYGCAATAPEPPGKPATEAHEFSFDGWDAPFGSVTEALEIHALFRSYPRVYEVTFSADGVVLKRESVEYLGSATPPEDPARASTPACDYAFCGWDGDYRRITEDTAFSAVFTATPRFYTVRFFSEGVQIKTERVAYGGSAVAPENPEKPSDPAYDYRFDGWNRDFTNVAGDLDAEAVFLALPRSYPVRFFSDGQLLKTETVVFGGAATAPELVPKKPSSAEFDYEFAGWDVAFDRIEGETEVRAVFRESPRSYTVTFFADGVPICTRNVRYKEAAIAPAAPEKPSSAEFDFDFTGWDGDFGAVAKNLEIHAVYRADLRSYPVTFRVDGVAVSEAVVPYGRAAVAPAPPEKASDAEFDYEFAGWDKTFDRVTGALDIGAVFRRVRRSYVVTLFADNAVLEIRTLFYGDPIGALPEEVGIKPVARFEDAGGNVYTGMEPVSGTLTLFAVFEAPQVDPYFGTEGLEFSYDPDRNGYSVEYYTGNDSEVIVPTRYRGADGDLPVVKLGAGVFSERALTSVVLPDTLAAIGDRAFYYAIGLNRIDLPASLTEIGDYAFYGAEVLAELVLPASVRRIGNWAFSEDPAFRLVLTGGGVGEIGLVDRDLRVVVGEEFLPLYRERFRDRPELVFTAVPAAFSKK